MPQRLHPQKLTFLAQEIRIKWSAKLRLYLITAYLNDFLAMQVEYRRYPLIRHPLIRRFWENLDFFFKNKKIIRNLFITFLYKKVTFWLILLFKKKFTALFCCYPGLDSWVMLLLDTSNLLCCIFKIEERNRSLGCKNKQIIW